MYHSFAKAIIANRKINVYELKTTGVFLYRLISDITNTTDNIKINNNLVHYKFIRICFLFCALIN